eukprot:13185472-Ditylum_brightwellii.AAC.1
MINLSQAQLLSGSSLPFLEEFKSNKSYIPTNWLLTIQTFLVECKGQITTPSAWWLCKQCAQYVFLMDKCGTTNPKDHTLLLLKSVHLYLCVTTLANIVDETGHFILSWALTSTACTHPTIVWPNQTKSPPSSWSIWHTYLHKSFATAITKQLCP